MKKEIQKNKVIVYQAKNGAIELRSDFEKETIWATQAEIVQLFDVDQSVVSRHINNIFKDKEINQKSNMQKMHIANSDKPVVFYSLDVILAVGYRANSARAITFRQWATKTLRMKKLLPPGGAVDSASVLELISAFADTWLSLYAYDKDELITKGATKKSVALTAEQLGKALLDFKASLIKKGQATELFGQERSMGSIAGIVGNVMQSFSGKPIYATVEGKAANLLYFMVKNHPFTDGNKRSGAYAFIWFLKKAGIFDATKITPAALTALTLFVAESDPKNKERMIRLILQLLKK